MSVETRRQFAVVLFLIQLAGTASADPVPDALQKAYDMRNTMKTAYLKYRMGSTSGFHGKMQIKTRECKIVGASYFVTDYGDEDGVMWLDMSGTPRLGMPNSCSPKMDLFDSEKSERWLYMQGMRSASVRSKGVGAFDVRCVGLSVMLGLTSFEETRNDLTEMFAAASKSSTRKNGDLIEITMEREFDESGSLQKRRTVSEWVVDPAKDFAVIKRVGTIHMQDSTVKRWGECETQYKQIDGHWFPSKSSGRYINTLRNDQEKRYEYELVDATFDRPDHPQKLTVDMLKIPAGTQVGRPETNEYQVWDGQQTLSSDKWRQIRRAQGWPKRHAALSSAQAADDFRYPAWWYDDTGTMGIIDLETNPDAWESYVRRWCMKNSVDDKQRTEAKSVLESSRKEARAILAKRAPELDKIEALLKDKKLDTKKADELRAEANRLLAPIGDIFNRLKSRLESLLLQKQISASHKASANLPLTSTPAE